MKQSLSRALALREAGAPPVGHALPPSEGRRKGAPSRLDVFDPDLARNVGEALEDLLKVRIPVETGFDDDIDVLEQYDEHIEVAVAGCLDVLMPILSELWSLGVDWDQSGKRRS